MYERVFDSYLNQTLKPRRILVVQFSSAERMIVKEGLEYLFLDEPDFPPYVASFKLINRGLQELEQGESVVIASDDCLVPNNYLEILFGRMNLDPSIGIIAGQRIERGRVELSSMPFGSGRLISPRLIPKIFPHGYQVYSETMLLIQCEMFGMKNMVCKDTWIEHLRPASKRSLRCSGQASYQLGYPLIHTIARVGSLAFYERVSNLSLFLGHLEAMLNSYPKVDSKTRQVVKQIFAQRYREILRT